MVNDFFMFCRLHRLALLTTMKQVNVSGAVRHRWRASA
jgi:hypothetical protein